MDEIQKDTLQALQCCSMNDGNPCKGCPYLQTYDKFCIQELAENALAMIQQLQKERDAAVSDMKEAQGSVCLVCKHYYKPNPDIQRYACRFFGDFFKKGINPADTIWCGQFAWRGVQEKEEDTQT